ncbi:hypothetical protein C9I99_11845 [Photobacterium lutimaris]|uniref:Uncharacterized protein n=1 Tax=Photobacterium lutimaris TaxID=388278 RepID=A0A2T3IZE9_9GAMM|nr:hypothetical protein C9I99_11845 [Photobacterium lutimaris]
MLTALNWLMSQGVVSDVMEPMITILALSLVEALRYLDVNWKTAATGGAVFLWGAYQNSLQANKCVRLG